MVESVVQGVVRVAYGYCLMDAVEGLTELDEFDALFDLHPDEFVAGRDALVKQLRSEKRRDEAALVAKLRRPSAGVWAINVAARRNPALAERLRDVGAAALQVQKGVLAGGSPTDLQPAVERRRAVVGEVLNVARAVLDERNLSAVALLASMRTALETISMDSALVELFLVGRLESLPDPGDLSMLGFGVGATAMPIAKPIAKPVLVPALPSAEPNIIDSLDEPGGRETVGVEAKTEAAEQDRPDEVLRRAAADDDVRRRVAEMAEAAKAAEILAASAVVAQQHVREVRLFADRAEKAAESNLEAARIEVDSLRLILAEHEGVRDSLLRDVQAESATASALKCAMVSTREEIVKLNARLSLLEKDLKGTEQALAASDQRVIQGLADLEPVTELIEASKQELVSALEQAEVASSAFSTLRAKV